MDPVTSNAWIVRPNNGSDGPTKPRVRLFCLPYAGAGASAFRLWPAAFPDTVEVCRIQLPGRENRFRDPAYADIAELVAALAGQIEGYLDRPFAFFGHSMGALISFELARECRRRFKLTPSFLFASAYRAPHEPHPPAIQHLPEEQFIAAVRNRFGGIPEAVVRNREVLELMLPVLRADFGICASHHYTDEAPLNCPIAAYGGRQDAWITRDHLAGWEQHTEDEFVLRWFPGDHFFLDSAHEALSGSVLDTLERRGLLE